MLPQSEGVPVAGVSTVLSATIEFSTEIAPFVLNRPPALVWLAVVPPSLKTTVELRIVVVLLASPSLVIPPPSAAELSVTVEF